MNDQLMSLQRIFTDSLYRIPDYQRGYAWEEKEVNDFWNDLKRLQDENNHYVGVLTLEPVCEEEYSKWIDDLWLIKSRSYRPYYVVDGQQRLTTSILLIMAILEIMREKNISRLNYFTEEQIENRFIKEFKDENHASSYMFSYTTDNPSYKYLIDCIYQGKLNIGNSQETLYTSNLEWAKGFFKEKLNCMDLEGLEKIFKKVTQHFLFNTYEISSDIDVFVTFETMNNRGKRLSYLELLKNRLIYISTLFDVDDDIKSRMRRDINLCWKTIYHLLGVNKERKLQDDDFLNAHFLLYFCKDLNSVEFNRGFYHPFGMYEYLLERHFVPQNVNTEKLSTNYVFDYIESLKGGIQCWTQINNPEYSNFSDEIKEYLKKIYYLCQDNYGGFAYYSRNSRMIKVLLMACLERNEKEASLLKFLKALEKHLFYIQFIPRECYLRSEDIELNYLDILLKLKSGDLTLTGIREKINKVCEKISNSIEIRKKLIKYYSRNGFYDTEFLRYFLCEYEVSLMKTSKNESEKLNRDIMYTENRDSIEHIYPQNARQKYWQEMFHEFNQKQRNSLRNSLGNFVAISRPKNSKLGNKSFPEKRGTKQNTVGYMYGTYSEMEISNNFEKWGAKEILERGIHLTHFIQSRWGLKIGDKKEIQEFLGLKFLEEFDI